MEIWGLPLWLFLLLTSVSLLIGKCIRIWLDRNKMRKQEELKELRKQSKIQEKRNQKLRKKQGKEAKKKDKLLEKEAEDASLAQKE